MTTPLPAPRIGPDGAAFWQGANRGELLLQRCTDCGRARYFPSLVCPDCGSDAAEWVAASGRGSVYSFTIVHRAPSQAFRGRVPYVIALVDLDEGPRMMANIIGDDALSVAVGDPVTVDFETAENGQAVPQFRKVGGGS